MTSLQVTLYDSLPVWDINKIVLAVSELLSRIKIKHAISITSSGAFFKEPDGSSLKFEEKFEIVNGKKVLFVKASGVVIPSESSSKWKEIELYLENLVDGAQAVIVDLGGVPYIDSVGLSVLVTFFTFLNKRNIQLVYANPTKRVNDKLRISRLNTIFNIAENEELALKRI
ncbi:MAG: STAS domain-containing protein [Patescibacteria group bacterium]